MPCRRTCLVLVAFVCLTVSACEGSKHENPFSTCGDGACNSGEECDDGAVTNPPPDNDPCLSTCRFNLCGDGFVNENPSPLGHQICAEVPADALPSEECDPGDFSTTITCASLGLAGDEASCGSNCKIDSSTCGAPFTPTSTRLATSTPTPTSTFSGPTPTPTTTPTPTPTSLDTCGNGVVDSGETCDDGGVCEGGENDGAVCARNTSGSRCIGGANQGNACSTGVDCPQGQCPVPCTGGTCVLRQDDACPVSCMFETCTPGSTTRDVRVDLLIPSGGPATSVTFFVDYPEDAVSLPGSGIGSPTVRVRLFFGTCDTPGAEFCERPADCPGNATCNRLAGTVVANDFDHALRVVVDATSGVREQPAFFIRFDECTGASPAPISSFNCTVQGCSGEFGLIEDCECTISEP